LAQALAVPAREQGGRAQEQGGPAQERDGRAQDRDVPGLAQRVEESRRVGPVRAPDVPWGRLQRAPVRVPGALETQQAE
jgi:hypothetical protein